MRHHGDSIGIRYDPEYPPGIEVSSKQIADDLSDIALFAGNAGVTIALDSLQVGDLPFKVGTHDSWELILALRQYGKARSKGAFISPETAQTYLVALKPGREAARVAMTNLRHLPAPSSIAAVQLAA